jgi:hypothetical protein
MLWLYYGTACVTLARQAADKDGGSTVAAEGGSLSSLIQGLAATAEVWAGTACSTPTYPVQLATSAGGTTNLYSGACLAKVHWEPPW